MKRRPHTPTPIRVIKPTDPDWPGEAPPYGQDEFVPPQDVVSQARTQHGEGRSTSRTAKMLQDLRRAQ